MFEPVNNNTTNTAVIEMCTFIAGDNTSDVFQVWAESEANTMRKLVLIVFTRVVDILPPMSTCLNLNQHRVNTHLLIIHIPCGHYQSYQNINITTTDKANYNIHEDTQE